LGDPEVESLNAQIFSAQKGDEEAFAFLVEKFQTPVFNLCYRMLGDPAEAEDAAQESFWRAFQGLKHYDPKRSFPTWLLSVSAHYCIDQIRKRHMVVLPMDILPEEAAPDPAPSPEISYSRQEEDQALHSLLNQLNSQDRAAIILRYWYEFSEVEIADALSLSVSAVKSRLHRARLELAKLWQDKQESAGKTSPGFPLLENNPQIPDRRCNKEVI
jgi:RNA polymerase sigma-70 factor, ECF subfamily